jgi:hypothetical protein
VTTQTQNTSTIASLLQDLRDETTTLLRQEVALAKAELSQKTSKMTKQAVKLAIGGFIAYAGLIVLLFGFADLLSVGLSAMGLSPSTAAWLGPAIIGIVVALIGYLMLAHAKKVMTEDTLVPERTIDSLRENKDWAKTKLRNSNEQPAL